MIKKISRYLEKLNKEKLANNNKILELTKDAERIDNEIKSFASLKKDYEKIEKKYNELTTVKEGNANDR